MVLAIIIGNSIVFGRQRLIMSAPTQEVKNEIESYSAPDVQTPAERQATYALNR
jgi:hypothetical protein